MAFKLEGIRELNATLEGMKTATAKSTARRAMQKSLEPVAAAARARVPVRSGKLKASIGVGYKLKRSQQGGEERRGNDKVLVAYAGSLSPLAHLQEFGTVKMGPQPFMRPAWDANSAGVLASMTDYLRIEIDKTVARAARRAAKAAAKAGK